MAMSRNDVFSKVRGVLVDALGVDNGEVTENARIQADLNAESIDFLDIVFRLEKAFAIKIPRGELFPEDVLSNPEYVSNGVLTGVGLAKLKESMPHADFQEFESDPQLTKVPDLITVRTITNYVQSKLQDGKTAAAV